MNTYRKLGKILPLLKSAEIIKFACLLLTGHSEALNYVCVCIELCLEEDLAFELSRTKISA